MHQRGSTVNEAKDNEAIALEHFERVWLRDPEIFELYTDDIVWTSTGFRIEGKEKFRAHLQARFDNFPHIKRPKIEHVSSSGSTVVVVLEATFAEGVMRAAEVFEIDNGKIRSNSIYFQRVEGFTDELIANLTHRADDPTPST
jgi:hypothetical protein